MNLQHIADIAWQYLGSQQLNEHQAAYGILAENGFNNPAAYSLVDTWNELYGFWRNTRNHEFYNNDAGLQESVNTTVMMCFLANQVVKYPNLQQGITQQAADTYNQWLSLSGQLEVEMDSFYRPSPVRNYQPQPNQYQQPQQQNYVDPRFQRGMSPAQFANRQQTGYQQPYTQQPNMYQQTYQQPNNQPVQQQYQHPQAPQQQPSYLTTNGRTHSRYGSQVQQPVQQHTHQPQPVGQATMSRKYESKTRQPDPQPQPPVSQQYQRPLTPQQQQNAQQLHDSWQVEVASAPTAKMKGRDLAEARYGDVTDGSWDGDSIVGDHSFDPMTPLFEERISSTNGGQQLTYVNGEGKPFTISDWRKKPDPDFPYELGYAPRTHRRVIAWDHKKECYIQIVEEHGQVDYDAHKQLEGSAVVRKRTPAERERNPFDPAGTKVTTLGEAIERRQEIIDRRVAVAKEAWGVQEAAAVAAAEENGNAYVAPDLNPPSDLVQSMPLPDETQEQIDAGNGKLDTGVLSAGILKNAYLNIEHALYGLRADNVLAGIDTSQVTSTEFVFHEVAPFILDEGDYDFVRNQLTNLTKDSEIRSLPEVAEHLKKIAKHIPQELWTKYNDQATIYINSVLTNELNLDGVTIDSFVDDLAGLPAYLKENYPEALKALSDNGDKLYRNLMCILPVTTFESYEKISRNLFGDQTEQLNDRSVFVSRKLAVAKVKASTEQLGIYSDARSCALTEKSHPNLWWMLNGILVRNAALVEREQFDGAAQYLVTADNAVFTIHESWVDKEEGVIIIRRQRVL